jgi:hypothetical protein
MLLSTCDGVDGRLARDVAENDPDRADGALTQLVFAKQVPFD